MVYHLQHKHSLFKSIRNKEIQLAGNIQTKIYGSLRCKSGKRMKIENRVFFETETEAVALGFRPYKHCIQGVR